MPTSATALASHPQRPAFPEAACYSDDPAEKAQMAALFAARRKAHVNKAKAICRGCPHLLACLEYSLLTWEPYGTWGGVSEVQRQELFRQNRLAKTGGRSAA